MQLPARFIAQIIELESESFGGQESESNSGRTIVSNMTGHRLKGYIKTKPLDVDDMRDLSAWLDSLEGGSTIITASIPLLNVKRGSSPVNPTVRAEARAGSKIIYLQNLFPNQNRVIMPDDLMTFSGHPKGYTASLRMSGDRIETNSWNSDERGRCTIYLTKPLLTNVAIGEVVNITTPQLTVRMSKNSWKRLLQPANGRRVVLNFPFKEHY
ncbi:hypothetical protein P4S73_04620 [Paraglaciecola sp. Hal342]|jgi:hypothetical protein